MCLLNIENPVGPPPRPSTSRLRNPPKIHTRVAGVKAEDTCDPSSMPLEHPAPSLTVTVTTINYAATPQGLCKGMCDALGASERRCLHRG
jgi:hypothetical protein